MTWKEQWLLMFLLLIARLACDDPVVREQLKRLSTDVYVNGRNPLQVEHGS